MKAASVSGQHCRGKRPCLGGESARTGRIRPHPTCAGDLVRTLRLALLIMAASACGRPAEMPVPSDGERTTEFDCPGTVGTPARPPLSLRLVQSDPTIEGRWMPGFPDGAVGREPTSDDLPVYSSAMAIEYESGSLQVTVDEGSPSGDFQVVTKHCFRSDGTSAARQTDLSTFHGVHPELTGPWYQSTIRRFDPCGLEVEATTLPIQRLPTGSPAADAQIMEVPEPEVAHVRELAFWPLVETAWGREWPRPPACAGPEP